MRESFSKVVRFGSIVSFALLLFGCASSPIQSSGSPLSSDMVFISGGSFLMGSTEADGRIGFEIGIDELPQQKVDVRSFYIDRFEITETEYRRFLTMTGSRKYPGYWKEAGAADRIPVGFEKHPVSDVDWYDAVAYCRWAGKRLPSEVEWEKAARGTDGRSWPWGNQFEPGRANTLEASAGWKSPPGQEGYEVEGWKAPVGSHPVDVSPYGAFDMAGNVREWTASTYRSYPGNEKGMQRESDYLRMIRGGSYLTAAVFSRTAARTAVLPTIGPSEMDGWHSDYTYGFRCAKNRS